jgi:hypothetical protein
MEEFSCEWCGVGRVVIHGVEVLRDPHLIIDDRRIEIIDDRVFKFPYSIAYHSSCCTLCNIYEGERMRAEWAALSQAEKDRQCALVQDIINEIKAEEKANKK